MVNRLGEGKSEIADWEGFDDTVNRFENHVINLSLRTALILEPVTQSAEPFVVPPWKTWVVRWA
jgi:hypothetical protein